MTPEAIKHVCKALALCCVAVGGFGSMACVPFALTNRLDLIMTAGIYFVAGGVMITGGLLSFIVLDKTQSTV